MSQKVIVTTALPYANGPAHIGHIAGAYLPADIYVRFRRWVSPQDEIIMIGGTDEHGVPITLKAEAEGLTPQETVDKYHKVIEDSFEAFGIHHDNFSGTARPEHIKISQEFFEKAKQEAYLFQKAEKQMYCTGCNHFLPDRYIEGTCHHCGAAGARGDQCDACGKLIDAEKLIDPVCKFCGGTKLEEKESQHWFLDLPKLQPEITKWIESKEGQWKPNVYSTVRKKWLEEDLQPRCITRDLNWGVPVPGEEGKVLYVWFDAPIGYISSTAEYFKAKGTPERTDEFWKDPSTELIHFIGKDNIVFHTITWPGVLMSHGGDYILPTNVPANEFLNLEGQKLSTSKNHAIWAHEVVNNIDSELLRYYLATIMPENNDSDFTWDGFELAINELSGTFGNMANRYLTFNNKKFEGKVLSDTSLRTEEDLEFISEIRSLAQASKEKVLEYKFRDGLFDIMSIARASNKYMDTQAPWKMIKEDEVRTQVILACLFESLVMLSQMLKAFMPKTATKLENYLNISPLSFEEIIDYTLPTDHTISADIDILIQRPEEGIIEAEKEKLA
ncbi:MAG: methionine--tRNA ligase [Patescibacteria group bacterium]|nr:methionine--tRNA ligase [Patescibacteria group bacterium]